MLKRFWTYFISVLGAIGTGLQNYMAVVTFIESFVSSSSKTVWGIIQSTAIFFGGICSSLVNFFINIELLENFWERLTKKPFPKLSKWEKFRYWAGTAVFIGTGILFGLTAFAFGPVGALAIISIIAGVFVSVIMIIQEVETWLESFDNPNKEPPKSLKERFIEWKKSLTKGKVVGTVISIGNVVALSLLFTMGLASFFIGVGVPALPALIAGVCVAFTGGAFTEFYFYNRFLSDFCDKIKTNWEKMWKTSYPSIGFFCASANAVVNGALSYAAIIMITSLISAASIALPPFGIIIAIAATAAIFASAASFILGMDFWIRNSEKLTQYFKKTEGKNEKTDTTEKPNKQANGNTLSIQKSLGTTQNNNKEPLKLEPPKEEASASATLGKIHSLYFTPHEASSKKNDACFEENQRSLTESAPVPACGG